MCCYGTVLRPRLEVVKNIKRSYYTKGGPPDPTRHYWEVYFRILWGGRLQSGGFRIGVPKVPSETRKGKKCWTHFGALAGCEALPKFLFFSIVRMDNSL